MISLAATALAVTTALAQKTTTVRVEFSPGTHHQELQGSIEGDQSFDYIVPGEAGQWLTVAYTSDNMGSYINFYPPGSDEAMHVGPNLGNRFDGALPETGDYRVRVYLMPNAAHRGEIANFTIELTLSGGDAASGKSDSTDGPAAGPDFWVVTGVTAGEKLGVRSGPSNSHDVVGKLANSTRVRNLGCEIEASSRWCRVEVPGDGSLEGWVPGRYLTEASVAGAGDETRVQLRDDPNAPELFVRSSGEIDVSFKSGCSALYGADGSKIRAGGNCSAEELRQAAEAVQAYQR